MNFLREFGAYFIRPWAIIHKHLACSLATFLVDLVFYAAAAWAAAYVLHWYLFDRIVYRILGDLVDLVPAAIRAEGESAAGSLLLPLALYLAWQIALNLATIITGAFNSRLAGAVENTLPERAAPPTGKKSGFLFGLSQDLLMLAFSIVWSATLLALAHLPAVGTPLSLLLFWTVTPLVHGLYNLGYALLPLGLGYGDMARLALKSPARSAGLFLASSSGPFLVLFLATRLTWETTGFVALFALAALFRPLGVISGTTVGHELLVAAKKFRPARGFFVHARRILLAVLALLVAITAGQLAVQADSKLELLTCRYRLVSAGINLPRTEKSSSLLNKIGGLLAFIEKPVANLELDVTNPGTRTISVESAELSLVIATNEFAKTTLEGFSLEPGATRQLRFQITLDMRRLAKSIHLLIVSGDRLPVEIRAAVFLRTWLGTFRYPVRIAPS